MYTYARYTPPSICSPLPTFNAVELLLVPEKHHHAPETSQDYAKIPSTSNSHDSGPSRCDSEVRDAQLKHQQWQREDSSALTMKEGLLLNDGHWSVIQYLRIPDDASDLSFGTRY